MFSDCNSNCDVAANAPMFFKIILQNTLTQGKMEIPSGFVRKFGNCLKSPIMFKIPNGNTWEVELSKVGEAVWLEKGWKEFSEHYCLKHGHLLVFKYELNSHFNVLIFDMSAIEIEYPGNAAHSGQPCKDSKSKQIMNQNKDEDTLNMDEFRGNPACSEVLGAQRNAINFTSSNPWFKVVLKSSYVKQKYVAIPYMFVKKHMKGAAQVVMLKVEDKSWRVKLNVYLGNKGCKAAGLYRGFRSFLSENSLKKGDACVFELINNNILNVSIFRI